MMQIAELYKKYRESTGVSTDTRKIIKGNIFFALKGDKFNGNLFAQEALAIGASLVVADEQHFPEDEKIIIADDALKTIQRLANYHRLHSKAKVIAIAGSNGKTTTKELISAVLSTQFKTFSTRGNLNNHIGVPLTLLSMPDDTEKAVIEIGANHSGETFLLAEIAEPEFGLITNNGKDHLEGYGSIEGVRKGNGELYEFLRIRKGTAFVSADHEDLVGMSRGMKRVTYGSSRLADYPGSNESVFPFLKIRMQSLDINIETQLIGKYNFDNVMAAVAVGSYFGVSVQNIKKAISSYVPSDNRSQVLKRGSNTFILDAYNANPSSMAAAMENFLAMPVSNKVAILGDMLEMGEHSDVEHKEVISKIKNEKLNKVVFVGSEFGKALQKSGEDHLHFKNVIELKEWFDQQQFNETYFLLKGSRLIGLEKLLEEGEVKGEK